MIAPTFDREGYPTDETLSHIEHYGAAGGSVDWKPLFRFLVDAWSDRYGKVSYDDLSIDFVTGGWSGNESIITAVEANPLFMGLFWAASYRGGKHVFSLPEGMILP